MLVDILTSAKALAVAEEEVHQALSSTLPHDAPPPYSPTAAASERVLYCAAGPSIVLSTPSTPGSPLSPTSPVSPMLLPSEGYMRMPEPRIPARITTRAGPSPAARLIPVPVPAEPVTTVNPSQEANHGSPLKRTNSVPRPLPTPPTAPREIRRARPLPPLPDSGFASRSL